eukprot:GDKJ01016221.1.p1 GENE.GDKJ01016221.1~~GDKJ01016221.1.p1  ORF type:complete len:1016 (+),score=255.20 GDKJ01016221.1:381-3050(+)
MTHDLVLLSQGPDPHTAHEVHTLGVVESSNPDGVSIKIFLDNPSTNNENSAAAASASRLQHNLFRLLKFAHNLNQLDKVTWYLSRVMNLSTMQREYLALRSVPNSPLVDDILCGQSSNAAVVAKLKPNLDAGDSFNPPTATTGVANVSKLVIPKKLTKVLKKNFNSSQFAAVEASMKIHGITLIQGPPGTGKTSTIMGVLSALLTASVRVQEGNEERKTKKKDDEMMDGDASTDEGEDDDEEMNDNPHHKRSYRKGDSGSDDSDADDRYEQKIKARREALALFKRQGSSESALQTLLKSETVGSVPSASPFQSNMEHYRKAMPWMFDPHHANWLDTEGLNLRRNALLATTRPAAPPAPLIIHKETKSARPRKILICAPSNAAVDELMRRVVGGGCLDAFGHSTIPNLVRIGPNIHPSLQEYSLETMATRRMKQRSLPAAQKDQVKAEILNEARIIAATLSSCGSKDFAFLAMGELDTVVVDEASQGIELSTLIALQYGCKRLILVGDPKQLPATVFSATATEYFFDRSLFQRLESLGNPVTMLSVQYRMHPTLSAYPSKQFYNSQLKDAENIKDLVPEVPFHSLPIFKPLMFFHLETVEARGATGSVSNPDEARFVVQLLLVLMKLLPEINWVQEVGIISPYADQVSLIRSYVKAALKLDPTRPCPVDVNTVDGFQGREKQTIIFSAVRAHPKTDALGFVTDKRRLNVALTRARRNLFIVGHANKLMFNSDWKALITYTESHRSFMRVSSPQSSFLLRFMNSWLPRYPEAWVPPIIAQSANRQITDELIEEVRNVVGDETTADQARVAAEKALEKQRLRKEARSKRKQDKPDDGDEDLEDVYSLASDDEYDDEDAEEMHVIDDKLKFLDRGLAEEDFETQTQQKTAEEV